MYIPDLHDYMINNTIHIMIGAGSDFKEYAYLFLNVKDNKLKSISYF